MDVEYINICLKNIQIGFVSSSLSIMLIINDTSPHKVDVIYYIIYTVPNIYNDTLSIFLSC